MTQPGPQLEALLHRLADCPPDFLLPPHEISVPAILCDHWRVLGLHSPESAQLSFVESALPELQQLLAVLLWLLRDEWFVARPQLADATLRLLKSGQLAQLARLVGAEDFIHDPDRREELVRLCLMKLKLRPQGETAEQAADRLTTLDSVERDRVIRETRAAEARVREVRAAMARKAAEEAAARYSPE
ncbi:MAG: hypothetical protein KDB22_24095 [Planctomycetales bacterium]|nr:hypothetical protein [Planctomycetales bacterium]